MIDFILIFEVESITSLAVELKDIERENLDISDHSLAKCQISQYQ